MTAKQIEKKIAVAGIKLDNLKISRDEVRVCVQDQWGDCDRDATDRLMKKVKKAAGMGGGFRTAYGAWVLEAEPVVRNPYDGYCMQS
jgi:hypothetical protein